MATCTLKLYKVEFTPEMNAKVDNLAHYLLLGGRLVQTLNNFQYQQIELNMSIKVVANEKYAAEKLANYASITQDGKTYYFYILSTEWTAQTTVKLNMSLDTINTFTDIVFTDKTNIIREHRNRWWNTEPLTYSQTKIFPKVDKVDEGVNPTKYSVTQETITKLDFPHDRKWYLVYRTPKEINEESIPLECLLVPSTAVRLRNAGTSGSYSFNESTLGDHQAMYFLRYNNVVSSSSSTGTKIQFYSGTNLQTYWIGQQSLGYTFIGFVLTGQDSGGGNYSTFHLIRQDNSSKTISFMTQQIDDNSTITVYNTLSYIRTTEKLNEDFGWVYENKVSTLLNTTSNALYTITFDQIDRTDTRLIKIIQCPYCPTNITLDPSNSYVVLPTGWSYTNDGYIKLDNLNTEFLEEIKDNHVFYSDIYVSLNPGWTSQARYLEDPKLKHSSFYDYKFLYDSFSIPVYLELLERPDLTQPMTWSIDYKQSNDITSDCLFKIRNHNWYYTSIQDYDLMLISNRNNEVSLYNSDYINYMRTGINYDRKQKNLEIKKSFVSAGISIIGAIVTAVTGGAAAGATAGISKIAIKTVGTTAIASLANAIMNTEQKQHSFTSKIDELQKQSTTVLNTENLNLLNYYNGNKLLLMTWEPSEEMKKNLDDLFYYCGYATNEKRIPNVNTRYWFNYIQCDPVFDENTVATYNDFIADIKVRYNAGVTVYHEAVNGTWDFAQVKENWETILIS